MVLCGTLLSSVSAVRFARKVASLDGVFCHSQMAGVTNFGLVLVNYIVIVMIFIKKNDFFERFYVFKSKEDPQICIWRV